MWIQILDGPEEWLDARLPTDRLPKMMGLSGYQSEEQVVANQPDGPLHAYRLEGTQVGTSGELIGRYRYVGPISHAPCIEEEHEPPAPT